MEGEVNYTQDYRSTDELPTPYIDERCIHYINSILQVQPRVDEFQNLQPTSMKYELLRLLTLLSYRRHDKPDIVCIAVAGFYYASDSDEVVCFCCGLTVRGLRSNDNPVEVHCRFSRRCNFIQQNHVVNRIFFEQTPSEIAVFREFQFGTRETQEDFGFQFEDSSDNVQPILDHALPRSIAEDDRAVEENLFQNRRTQDEIRHILENSNDTAGGTSTVCSDDAGAIPNIMPYMERAQATQVQNTSQEPSVINLQQINNTNTAENGTLGSGGTGHMPNLMTPKKRVDVTQQQNNTQEAPSVKNLQRNDNTDNADDDTGPTSCLVTQMRLKNESLNIQSQETAGRCQPLQNNLISPIFQPQINPVINQQYINSVMSRTSNGQQTTQGRPLYLNLEQYESRLATFNSWPLEYILPSEELADAGLFYKGYSDCVCCFHCGQDLIKWKTEDEPWVEHVDKSPDCEYVREIWGNEFVRAVTEGDRDMLQTYKASFKTRRLRILNQFN